jgi:spore cortex biosynthesis protein YabQ
MESLVFQLIELLLAIITGIMIGMAFDVYRILIKRYKPPVRVVPLLDLVWWGIITVLVFFILLYISWGEVRFYLILAQVAGFFIYLKRIRFLLFPIFEKIFIILEKAVKSFARISLMLFLISKENNFVASGHYQFLLYSSLWKFFDGQVGMAVRQSISGPSPLCVADNKKTFFPGQQELAFPRRIFVQNL